MMKTDTLFYRFFQDYPQALFDLAGLDLPATGYTLRAEEVKETAFRLDGVLEAPEPTRPLVFMEVQVARDDDFYGRWFSEMLLFLRRRTDGTRPWRAVVVWTSRAVEHVVPTAYGPLVASPWVHRVYLEDVLRQRPTTAAQGLLHLLLARPRQVLNQAREMLVGASTRDPAWVDWVETILVYKLPTLTREEIRRMLHLIDVDLKETRFYQEVFAEGRDEGRDEGRNEGRDEGRKDEGEVLVLRLLQRRFGTLDAWQAERIRELPLPRLEALAEALLDFGTVDELSNWLRREGN